MGYYILATIIQLIGIGIPMAGLFALFKKEQTRTTLCLFLTDIACLFINYTYLLLLGSETADGAISIMKILYLGNALFYAAFILFMLNYLQLGHQGVRSVFMAVWAGIETVVLFMLWIGDPFHLVFREITVYADGLWGITYVSTISGPLYWIRNCILCVALTSGMIYTMFRMFRVRMKEEKENLGRLVGAQFIIVLALDISVIFHTDFDIVPICTSISILSIIIEVIHGEFFRVTDQGRQWVIEHFDNVFIVTDSKYGYLDANPYAKKLFPELRFLLKNDQLPGYLKNLFNDFSYNVEWKGRTYTKDVDAIVQEGKTVGYSMLLIDVTDQIQLMEQIEEEKERAEAANKAKSAFMSNMSHEIRTPMNAIVGMTDILLREELPEKAQEYLYNIRSSGDALLTIINDILDFSKIEAGQMDIIMDEYEPMSSFHDLSMIFMNRIGNKDVELLYDIDANLPMKLYGDRQRIRQVIINLMNNAIKFTDSGFVKLTVKVNILSDEDVEVTYLIEDSGQGIKEEDMDKLFGTYTQVDKEKNHFKEGTGLGLSICKQLVELMNGTIGVTSEYGKGSCFYFTIPQKIRSEKKAASIKEERAASVVLSGKFINPQIKEQYQKLIETYGIKTVDFADVYEHRAKADILFTDDVDMLTISLCEHMNECNIALCVLHNPMQQDLSDKKALLINKPLYNLNFCSVINGEDVFGKKANDAMCFIAPDAKILIVDDQEMNLKVAKGLLEPLQLQIDTAENGKQALDKVQKYHYDMVFMDHMMPVMDGVEATKAIRALEGEYFQDLPIIALSANATTEAQNLFRQSGFFDFVPKPIKVQEICSVIRKWLPLGMVVIEDSEKIAARKQKAEGEELVIEGLDVKEGIQNSGTKALFLSLLGDFYKLIDQKSTKVEKCLADGLIRDYTIEVHALKSTARMIGAMELSEKFYRLEQLGNAEDVNTLEKETPDVLSLYRSYKPILEPFGKMKDQEKQEVPVEEMISTLQALKEAMDCFDLDGADEAMHKLEGFAFPESCQSKVEELSAFVADVAMEDVMNLAEELVSELQK